MLKLKALLSFIILSLSLPGHDTTQVKKTTCQKPEEEPIAVGNFALPTSQQIAPLISFGQLETSKGVLQYYLYGDFLWGNETYTTILTPSILYGITDDLDVFLQVPLSPRNREGNQYSEGMEDVILQFEYAYYNFNTYRSSNQATVVSYISFPTGDPHKEPATGFGAPAFFIGGTFSRTTLGWYGFFSGGALFPAERHKTRFGNEYFYQFGYEQVIYAKENQMFFAWMIEFDGTLSKKDRILGIIDPDSGGNTILITPSFYFSTKRWIIQGGIGFPVFQSLPGNSAKNDLGIFFSIGFTA